MNKNLSSLSELETRTQTITTTKHSKEINLLEELLNYGLTGFEKIEKYTIISDNDLVYAWLLLSIRSFNSLRCSFNSMIQGYYSQSMILARSIFEDWLTAKDCEKNQKTLEALLHRDNEYFRKEGRYSQMAKRLSAEFPSTWGKIYGDLSKLAHARPDALVMLVDSQTKNLMLGSYYKDDLFMASYQTLLAVASIIPEIIYHLLGTQATQWWEGILPLLKEAKSEIERVATIVE